MVVLMLLSYFFAVECIIVILTIIEVSISIIKFAHTECISISIMRNNVVTSATATAHYTVLDKEPSHIYETHASYDSWCQNHRANTPKYVILVNTSSTAKDY